MLVEINCLNFEHHRIKFWIERHPVKGGANQEIVPENQPIVAGTCLEWAKMLCYRKGLGSLSHYTGPVGPGSLPENPFQLLASFIDEFPAAICRLISIYLKFHCRIQGTEK